jgi:hypothetical protein
LEGAFKLYWRVPVLFLVLAAIVVVPYELIVLMITGAGPFAQRHLGFLAGKGLLAIDSFLITPLISAFHVHAIRKVGDGGRPRLGATVRKSLPRLPVVAVAAGVSGIAISIGSLAFAIPGLLLIAIWPVVAQAAALEDIGWIGALQRSIELTRGRRWHSLGLVVCAALIAGVPLIPISLAFGSTTTTLASFLAGTAVQVIFRSFEALATGLLYFDLVAGTQTEHPPSVPRTDHPLDALSWSDENRPANWYVDPGNPRKMRYWAGGGTTGWSEHTAKTPRPTLVAWEEMRSRSEPERES